jgi:sulfonate dioxygenase
MTIQSRPPLYPEYLPTRPDGYSKTIDVPPFDADERGLHADPTLPHLRDADVSLVDLTPTLGTEINGLQLSKLDKAGLDEVALFAAERGVLVFVSRTLANLAHSKRDQDFADIGPERQKAIVQHYGPLHLHPTMGYPAGTGPEFHVVYADEHVYVIPVERD